MAGGLNPDAGDVCIIQKTSGGDQKGNQQIQSMVIDLDQLLIKGDIGLNIPVSSGDVIHVPQAGIFFVDGGVNGPGSFPLKGKITFTQAISMAKGFNYEAVQSDVKIYRDTGKPEREMITVDYNSILDGKSMDVEIKDKDVIIVSKSGLKGFVGKLTTGLSFGIFRLGTYGAGF
jgi:protein involved in polysaccharide export with SLBB domain